MLINIFERGTELLLFALMCYSLLFSFYILHVLLILTLAWRKMFRNLCAINSSANSTSRQMCSRSIFGVK